MGQPLATTRRMALKKGRRPWEVKCAEGKTKEALELLIRLKAAMMAIERFWPPRHIANEFLGIQGTNTVFKHATKLLDSMDAYKITQLIVDIPAVIAEIDRLTAQISADRNRSQYGDQTRQRE